jgi:hypothetical protein
VLQVLLLELFTEANTLKQIDFQCHWNYIDKKDVAKINRKFEELDILMMFFGWTLNPIEMINKIVGYGRKMVTIVE